MTSDSICCGNLSQGDTHFSKFNQALSGDYIHVRNLSQSEIDVNKKYTGSPYRGNPLEINRRLSDAVEGALQVADISGHYMGVYLRGLDIRVAEQFLEDADIDPVF
jgi:hypothetical protein